ncbi:MAG TPA: hypothetical protein PKC69_01780 [Chitinophagaceae bacterium]|nr:hypothetical protein [Chitinophagaceae bacterium]
MRAYLPFRLLLAGFFSLFLITASAQKKFDAAIDLNDYLATITDTLYTGGGEWGTQLSQGKAAKNFSPLEKTRMKMELFCYRKHYELSKMTPQFGSQELIQALKDFLDFEIQLISNHFTPFEKMNASTPMEKIDKQLELLTAAAQDEGTALKKVNDAQVAFANKNGFTLESKED